MDGIRSEYIRGTPHVRCYGDKTAVKEARLNWLGHVERRDSENISGGILWLDLEVKRKSVDSWLSMI